MRIDNSAANSWRKCPLKYAERYVEIYPGSELVGIEPQGDMGYDFGARMHELLHEYRAGLLGLFRPPFPPLKNEALEAEAQATFAAYLATYPVEPFEFVEAERVHVVPLPNSHHELVVKMDAVVRNRYGALQVLDVKTQKRNSHNNDPEHWAARPQISLYVYAARILYPDQEVSDEVIIDLVRRASPKGEVGPEFHRDFPRRSVEQIGRDLRDLIYVADRIEDSKAAGYYPAFRDNCKVGNWKCDFYDLHVSEGARDEILSRRFKPAEPYLEVE